ncbi:hypothetical protein MFIFM68171_04849 [Madurella fahalii]|uniref:Uncharacterized protein n=1 Tax=Madurella fahalii TaxID=1157608 RepID=A0ABQ0GAE0_9PEZI
MPDSVSHTESHSLEGSQRKPWLPPTVIIAIFSLAVASTVGVAMSAVVFSSAEDLQKPGIAVAQSFVMFASILSVLYLLAHISAARKGDDLYFDPRVPSFRHQLHTSAITVARIAVAMWASAIIAVAIAIHRGRSGHNTINLKVDIFACALGFLSGCYMLFVFKLANRPFDTPWISPLYFDDYAAAGGVFDDATSHLTLGSASIRILGGPVEARSKTHAKSPSNTSSSTSSSRSRARKMSQIRRYVLDAPNPVPLSPPKLQTSGDLDCFGKVEQSLVPDASKSESFFAASTDNRQDKSGPSGKERSVAPDAENAPLSPPSPSQQPAFVQGIG